MKFESAPHPEKKEKTVYDQLKTDLLKGRIAFQTVKDKLVELDQATEMRDAARENLEFLYDPDVVKAAHKDAAAYGAYIWLLGFTEFHVAQICALSGAGGR